MIEFLPPHNPNLLNRIIMALAATRPIAWVLAAVLRPIDRWVLKRTRGRYTATSLLAGRPVIVLTTIGAKSGQPHQIPLMFITDHDRVIVFATNFGSPRHPAWVHNLRANPRAIVTYDGRSVPVMARTSQASERHRYWAAAAALYPGYAAYRKRINSRTVPVMVLEPIPDGD
jgi:deazaflavin-dependent oxidoreductase (nitroreductase family)